MVRTLPLRLAPIDGESLPGYIARYSHRFQLPPGDLICALGLDGGSGNVLDAGRYGAWLTPAQLEQVALTSGIRAATIERMLLSRYAGRVFARPAGSSFDSALAVAGLARSLTIRCSRFCPECLRANGAWLLGWQLSWSCVCVSHRIVLRRRCPRCDAVPKSMLRDRWPTDRAGVLTDPGYCAARVNGELCRTPLTNAAAASPGAASVAAQNRINAILNGQLQPMLAGMQLEPPVYLRDLLTLCNLLHHHAQPRASAVPSGRRLQDDPEELVSVLPDAFALADLLDPEALVEQLREIADRRYRADGVTLLASKTRGMSAQLEGVMRRAVSHATWASASRQLGLHPDAHRRPEDLDARLEPRHVPQLFWSEDYERTIAELFDFDDFSHRLGRRFCSVLLARMLTPLDWQGAVRSLDFPDQFINHGYNTTFVKLRSNGQFDELARRVKRAANDHASELVDYEQRRTLLSTWNGIDLECWHLLHPGVRPPSPFYRRDAPKRRQRASLWLWCQLTSGHERASPIPLPTGRGLFAHTEFIRDTLPPLRDRLLILGQLLISTPANARSTLHNRLAATLHNRGHLAKNYSVDTLDPLIADRVLAHVAAHTGVDIPTLTIPSAGSHAPAAITHARMLTARLLRTTALASWRSITAVLAGHVNAITATDQRYRETLNRDQRLADELDRLATSIAHWHVPAPAPPSTPHADRMRELAVAIRTQAEALLAGTDGADVARRTSMALCRQHTDLACPVIAAIHGTDEAEPAWSHQTVARLRRQDPDYACTHRKLLAACKAHQHQAGFANANLKRGMVRGRAKGVS